MKEMRIILPLVLLFLAGCAKEPMIKLSDERKAQIESKAQESESATDSDQNEAVTPLDRQQAELADSSVSFDSITEFLPVQPNTFLEGQVLSTYMDYVDSQSQRMQVRNVSSETDQVSFFGWDTQALYYLGQNESLQVPVNQLGLLANTDPLQTWLQIPLEKGATWQVDGETTAEVVNIYQALTIGDTTLSDVVEVKYTDANQTIYRFFARQLGLVAIESVSNDVTTTMQQVDTIYQDSRFSRSVRIYQAQEDQNSVRLTQDQATVSWQTNDQFGLIYTQLFRDLGWIDDQIVVNNVTISDGMVQVDFSAGIVAVLNSNPLGEAGLIPAIVATVADHFQVSNVQLTVNGLGLLPDTLEYPDGGIWQVDTAWFD